MNALKSARAKAFAAVTAGALLAVVAAPAPATSADPLQLSALVGVGVDTTQSLTNAFAGYSNGREYTALITPSGQQMISFDAVNPTNPLNACVTVKVGVGSQHRSNGSLEGLRALSRAIDGGGYGPPTSCGGTKDISGQVDFSRSVRGPAAGDSGIALTYLPFARDAVSFAYATRGVSSPITSFTVAQLTQLYTSTTFPVVVGGVNVYPCGVQNGSGTYSFWNTAIEVTGTQEAAATALCDSATTTTTGDGRVEENNATTLQARAAALFAGGGGPVEVIAGFNAASYIAQANGVIPSTLPFTGGSVNLGVIDDDGTGVYLGPPAIGIAPNLTPNANFFSSGVFGRNDYYVVDTARLTAPGGFGLKQMFVATDATNSAGVSGLSANFVPVVCQAPAQSLANRFVYMSLFTGCGDTGIKGSLVAGNQ